MVSNVRRHLTVALCLDDHEVVDLCPTFPALSTCPSVRLQAWSSRSMESAAARSLSARLRLPAVANTDTASHFARPLAAAADAGKPGDKGRTCREQGKSQVCLWPGSTHAHLVGLLAFSRFQSTIPAFEGPSKASAAASADGSGGGRVADPTINDDQDAAHEAARLFDAWMVLAEPACCVEIFRAVEACAGDGGVDTGGDGSNGTGGAGGGGIKAEDDASASQVREQPCWRVVKDHCFRAMAQDGRGPRPVSLEEVLLLFKHLCKLGCRRQVA